MRREFGLDWHTVFKCPFFPQLKHVLSLGILHSDARWSFPHWRQVSFLVGGIREILLLGYRGGRRPMLLTLSSSWYFRILRIDDQQLQ